MQAIGMDIKVIRGNANMFLSPIFRDTRLGERCSD